MRRAQAGRVTLVARAALILVVGLTTGARADGGAEAEADRLIATGVALRQQTKDEEALAAFARAYELAHGARACAQMGLAEQALGRWEPAEAHLAESLAANDPWIARHTADLNAALAEIRGHLGTLEVRGGVAGADVLVNGVVVGHVPLSAPLRVTAGTIALEVRAAGYLPVIRNISVPAGGLARESVAMVSDVSAPEARPAPAVAAVVVAPAAPAPSAALPTSDKRKVAGWLTAGGAAVALGVGVAYTVRVYSNASKFNQSCGTLDGDMGGGLCPTYHDRSTSSEAPAIVGFGLAAALAGTSAYLLWSAHEHPPAASPLAWRCGPGPGAALACATTF